MSIDTKFIKRAVSIPPYLLVSCVLLSICLCLSSCSFISMKAIPAKKSEPLEKYVWAGEAHSTYAYDTLEPKLQAVYTDIAEACLSLTQKVNTDSINGEELSLVFQAVTRDYPIINWLGETYSYTNDFIGGSTVMIEYSRKKEEVNLMLAQLNGHTTVLLADINPELSDYEKATRVHDLLINTVTYDLKAQNQRDAFGAIVDKQATCQGYSKAYQFLLLKLGLDATIIYGEAGEPHAWNAVKIDDEYYYSDTTFDDRQLNSGQDFLSREYLFLNEKEMSVTHTPSKRETVFPLPKCTSNKENYFIKNGLVIDKADRYEIELTAKELARQTIDAGLTAFQIKFSSGEILKTVETDFMSSGLIDATISLEVSKYSGVKYIGRTIEDKTNVVTFILEYNK